MGTRQFILTLPTDLAEQTEQLARELDLTVQEFCVKGIARSNDYWVSTLEELNAPIDPNDPNSMSMAQVNELVHQARREDAESKAA